MSPRVKEIARKAGGVAVLANRLGISPQAIYQWSHIPIDKLDRVASATGLPRSALRPDLFGSMEESGTGKLYEADFAAWAMRQAEHLRSRNFDRLDIENLAEEVEDMARSHRDEIESRLSVLLLHLLKWRSQPESRSGSWRSTIVEQRDRIARRIKGSPSLKSYPAEVFPEEYAHARKLASVETGLPIEKFDESPPFTLDEALDLDYLPEAIG